MIFRVFCPPPQMMELLLDPLNWYQNLREPKSKYYTFFYKNQLISAEDLTRPYPQIHA